MDKPTPPTFSDPSALGFAMEGFRRGLTEEQIKTAGTQVLEAISAAQLEKRASLARRIKAMLPQKK